MSIASTSGTRSGVRWDPPIRPDIDFAAERFQMFVIDELAADYERSHDDVIRLTLGKSELPPDDAVVAAMVDAVSDHRKAARVHPAGLPELRERLAEEYWRRHDVEIPPDRFVVTAGSSAAFRNLCQLLLGAGDEVLLPLPYYPLYPISARLAGASVRHYRIDPATLRVDLDSLAAAITERTRMVVVNSPGNPLGNLVDADEFRRVDEVVAGRSLLVSDEIYGNVVFEDGRAFCAATLAGELRGPLVVTNAFSKGHRMYARRVGYAIVPDELVEPLVVVQQHTALTVDPVAQFGAIAALDNQTGVRALTTTYRARRDYALRRFTDLAGVVAHPALGGFYLTLDCSGRAADGVTLARRIMAAVHVAVVPGSDFGLPSALRLSYSAERFTEAVDRLVEFFAADLDG